MRNTFFVIPSFLVATAMVCAQPTNQEKSNSKSKVILQMVDYSGSIKNVEDTTQPFVCHLLKLAELSGEPIAFSVIFFGGDGVRVIPEKAPPSSAHKRLHHDLIKNWPKPKGGTPLDVAMEEAVRIVGGLPRGTDVSLVLFTDGTPDSGVLRPEAFPEVKAQVELLKKGIHAKKYPPVITQQLLVRLEKEILDGRTELYQRLYQIQSKAEFKKTLDHAEALKKAKVRFISVDYMGGIPALRQIHDAAGGRDKDLVVCSPASSVIDKLHKLGLTSLPQVVVQHPINKPAEPKDHESSVSLKLDALGDRALITVVFERPVGEFDKHLSLHASFDGNSYEFSTKNDDPTRILSFDNSGKVATAHLLLDRLPANQKVTLTLKSPGLSMTMPAWTIYQHLRVAKHIRPQFRPHHAPADALGPFSISPKQEVRWITAYRSEKSSKPYPIKSIEAVLRNVHTGAELRLQTQIDPQLAFTFVSDPERVPRGTYDVTLQTILDSGASITTLLSRHVKSELADEFIAVEIVPKMGEETENFSFHPGHVDFGPVGDDRIGGKVAITVRSMGLPYDVLVELTVEGLADEQGKSSKDAWVVPDRKKFLLKPGRPEKVFLILQLPKRIEEHLSDGLFKGQLSFVRLDIGEPMLVKRFQSIVGVPDGHPVDQVTFTLRRPKLEVCVPRCFRDTLLTEKDGRFVLPVQVSIAKPFGRMVTVEVHHTSKLSRQVTVLADGSFHGGEMKLAQHVRLTAAEGTEHTRDIAPGTTAVWTFQFKADDNYGLEKSLGRVVVSGPDFPTMYIEVEIRPRVPLLGKTWQLILWAVAVIMGLCLFFTLSRLVRLRRFREGNSVVISEDRPLSGFVRLKTTGRNQVTLLPEQPICYQVGDEPKKRLSENSPLTLKADSLSSARPLVIEQQTSDGEEGWSLNLEEVLIDPPEVHGEIEAAPSQAEETSACRRKGVRQSFVCIAAILTAALFFTPNVIRAAQWLWDFFTL